MFKFIVTGRSEESFEEALAEAMARAMIQAVHNYDVSLELIDMVHDEEAGEYKVVLEVTVIPMTDKDRFKIKSDEELNRIQLLSDFRKSRAEEGGALKRMLEDHFRARGTCPDVPLSMAGSLSEADILNGGVERRAFGLAFRDPLGIDVIDVTRGEDGGKTLRHNEAAEEAAFWVIGAREEFLIKALAEDMFGRAGEAAVKSDHIERKFAHVLEEIIESNDFRVESYGVGELEKRIEWLMREIWAREKEHLERLVHNEFQFASLVRHGPEAPEPEDDLPSIYDVLGRGAHRPEPS